MFDVNKAIAAQKTHQEKNCYPNFAPRNGICWYCRKNIYAEVLHESGERKYTTGITVEKAASELIIGCPHCHKSYCD